jgi:hypothetical protein
MTSHVKPVLFFVVGLVVLGASAAARAQSDGGDIVLAPEPQTPALVIPVPATVASRETRAPEINHHDTLFRTVTTALAITTSTDLSISMYQIGKGNAREAGFGASWQDSPVAFAVSKSAVAAAFMYGLQRLHKHHPKTAIVLGIGSTALEGWLTVRSARMSPATP